MFCGNEVHATKYRNRSFLRYAGARCAKRASLNFYDPGTDTLLPNRRHVGEGALRYFFPIEIPTRGCPFRMKLSDKYITVKHSTMFTFQRRSSEEEIPLFVGAAVGENNTSEHLVLIVIIIVIIIIIIIMMIRIGIMNMIMNMTIIIISCFIIMIIIVMISLF